MNQTMLTVPDISCGHCQTSIEGALRPLAGVEAVQVVIDAKTVEVTYTDAIAINELVAAIEAAGYEVPDPPL